MVVVNAVFGCTATHIAVAVISLAMQEYESGFFAAEFYIVLNLFIPEKYCQFV